MQIHLTRDGERTLRRIAGVQTEELSALMEGLGLHKRGLARVKSGRGEPCDASAAAAKKMGRPVT